jgi:uncharacterized repeat protein (TIGR01451 family)
LSLNKSSKIIELIDLILVLVIIKTIKMKRKLTLLGMLLTSFWQQATAQALSVNMEYVNVPGIGCHSRMLAYVNYGSQAESGAEIKIDWSDGYKDSMIVFGAPNSQSFYEFSHDYAQPGNYIALTTVKSGTLGGQLVASQTFDCVVTTTTECGFFTVSTFLNQFTSIVNNVPYDVTGASGTVTTIYPVYSYGNPYYAQLNESDAPFTVSINDDWLQNNGYVQTSPDFTITSFDPSGRAENLPMNLQLECSGTGLTPNLEITSASAFQFVAPLETGNVTIQMRNITCGNSADAEVKIAIPQGVTPDLTNLANATFANDTVTVIIPFLNSFTFGFPCTFAGNTPAGTIFDFYVEASAIGEQDFMFNSLPFQTTVLNSYDPNDKQCNLPEFIQPTVKENLVYTIRFQNDGNYPALNVVVRDTISPLLDLSTFKFISSKHPVSYSVDPVTRIASFRFSGINLLPSDENLDGSQGTFTYSIDELDNLALNSEIRNTAYIYFDFNPAIITNTTVNKNANVGLNSLDLEEVSVFPNPTAKEITLQIPENGSLVIYDLTGKIVLKKQVTTTQKIDVSHLAKGLYNLQVSTTKGSVSKKLIVE